MVRLIVVRPQMDQTSNDTPFAMALLKEGMPWFRSRKMGWEEQGVKGVVCGEYVLTMPPAYSEVLPFLCKCLCNKGKR